MSRKKHLKAKDGRWLDHRERLQQETITSEKKRKAEKLLRQRTNPSSGQTIWVYVRIKAVDAKEAENGKVSLHNASRAVRS
jgi:hypothetical protein